MQLKIHLIIVNDVSAHLIIPILSA